MIKPKVLFLCSENSCRAQMAEAFLRDTAGERFEAISAGVEATILDPEAVAAIAEVGLDISGQTPKKVDPFLGQRATFVVTLCGREIERAGPIFPGAIGRLKWPIENPASARSREETTHDAR
ncbi:MAG: arsenate reductase ArsC [Bryobacteraceae bacterium]